MEDRSVVETTDAERRTTKPAGLQESIDELAARYKHGRAFVRYGAYYIKLRSHKK